MMKYQRAFAAGAVAALVGVFSLPAWPLWGKFALVLAVTWFFL